MMLLFDASALLNVIRIYEEKAYRILKDNLILSLTRYEIGNALWREALLLRRISLEEALETMSLLNMVMEIMAAVDPSNGKMTLKLAHDLQITYHDAAYICAAAEKDAKLVTDDIKLMEKIWGSSSIITKMLGKKIEALSSDKIGLI